MAAVSTDVRRLKQASEWVVRLREDSLSERDIGRWLEWCEADDANLEAFESAQSMWRSIPSELAAQFDRPGASPKSGWRRQMGRPVAGWSLTALAGCLVLVVIGIFSFHGKDLIGDTAVHVTSIETPRRVIEHARLADGSDIALGADSRVAVEFTPERRHLQMQAGTAFFRVKADKTRPFVVSAGQVDITAIGTAFNVRRNSDRVVVSVQEGVVRVDGLNGEAVQATAGHTVTYESRSHQVRLEQGESLTELAWQQGQLVFNGEPLDAVIENVNRYANKPIVLDDPSLAHLRFTGTVFVDSIDTWLGALSRAFPVSVHHLEDRDVVVAATAASRVD